MDFFLSRKQKIVQETARRFAEKELAPRSAAIEVDRSALMPVLKSMADLGLIGMNISAKYNGSQAGAVSYSVAMTEIAKVCASTALTMHVTNMVGEVIQAFGGNRAKRTHISKLCNGQYSSGAFALTESSAGSDPSAMLTTAELDGGEYVLNGSKTFVSSAEHAGIFVVWAKTDKEAGARGISAFLVEQGKPGFRIDRNMEKMGQRGSCTNDIAFRNCRVSRTNLLGQERDGFRIAMMTLDGGRIGVGSLAVGIGLSAIEYATDYARSRIQFGKPISSFQAIQWMIADSFTELEAARLLVLQAAFLKEKGKIFTKEAAMAKLLASETSNRVCYKAQQILGGYGYSREYPLEKYARDCRATTIYEGTSEIQRNIIALRGLGLPRG